MDNSLGITLRDGNTPSGQHSNTPAQTLQMDNTPRGQQLQRLHSNVDNRITSEGVDQTTLRENNTDGIYIEKFLNDIEKFEAKFGFANKRNFLDNN